MSFHLYRNHVRWELVEGSFEILVHRGLFWEGVSRGNQIPRSHSCWESGEVEAILVGRLGRSAGH